MVGAERGSVSFAQKHVDYSAKNTNKHNLNESDDDSEYDDDSIEVERERLDISLRIQQLMKRVQLGDDVGSDGAPGVRLRTPDAEIMGRFLRDSAKAGPAEQWATVPSTITANSTDSDSIGPYAEPFHITSEPYHRMAATDSITETSNTSEGDWILNRSSQDPARQKLLVQVLDGMRKKVSVQAAAVQARDLSTQPAQPSAAAADLKPAAATGHARRRPNNLTDTFPELSLDPHTMRWLWSKHSKRIETVARNAVRDARRAPKERPVVQMVREERARMQRHQKDAAAASRRRAFQQQQAQSRSVASTLYERRRSAVKMKQYYDDFHRAQQTRLRRGRNEEELLLRSVFEDSIKQYTEEVRNAEKYAKEKQNALNQKHDDRLESISRWYRDQLDMLEDRLRAARASAANGDVDAVHRLQKVRRALSRQLEKRVQELQADLVHEGSYSIIHRAREARVF